MSIFRPTPHDKKFCTVVLPVLPATGHQAPSDPGAQALYICGKLVPCPDHPQKEQNDLA